MRILIVDEIGSYTDELVKFFRDKGHFVTPIESADEDSPLQILRTRRNEKVDILIFHTGRMPQAQSLTFCSFARQLWPEIFIRVDESEVFTNRLPISLAHIQNLVNWKKYLKVLLVKALGDKIKQSLF
ncbi:hypothetical protein A3H26_02180 [candidate division WWE3 bacterium RIFCSPLOWO2_12_FULL_36_10]|uniref:Response regulatory domain-containing protein n=1 Tax=candidate division WWE3 bacterium RIFCSPLOWO2_12_FULL_36_10 TaxID=1802630 RepID=A0A1F4VJJ3_UNCKA|nr:MAG: hypothetical protein A3H26_02180 [candidate division WWE3 bacterium RIFCSPLOWO2_12_FULL_36_10]